MMQKDKGIKRIIKSFKYSFNGLIDAYRTEQSVWIYIPVALLVILMGFLLKISNYEWMIVVLILGIILSLELVNTSLEAVVDLVTSEYKVLAKKAKDTVSAAVLIFAITSVVVGLIIFLPKILSLF